MRRASVLGVECSFDEGDPAGYRSAVANVGRLVGGEAGSPKQTPGFRPERKRSAEMARRSHHSASRHVVRMRIGTWMR